MQERTPATAGATGLLSDRAYAALRNRLISLAIPPGAPIDEDALTGELGVGRTPVREAVRRLALEGLVVVFPRRGTFASSIDITSLTDITDVRCQLEPHAAARAARLADAADRAEAAELMSELERVAADQGSLIELDARIHRFVHRCSRNPYLARDLDRYLNMSLRIWHLTFDAPAAARRPGARGTAPCSRPSGRGRRRGGTGDRAPSTLDPRARCERRSWPAPR
jgi:DNA-binding GntR family transcriptional regulator